MMVLPEQPKIMKSGMNVLILAASLAALSATAQVPGLLSHQGKVTVAGTNYTGTGLFRFALVNAAGTTTYWSNDGTSAAGSPPAAAISLAVARGVFSVNLGDTNVANMTQTIPASAFSTDAVYLRVWFNDGGNGSQLLTPDRRITSVAYALQAATATTVATPPGMVLIPAGSFTMGNSIGDSDINNAATVTATVSAFYMDVNLVTLSQWQSVYYWATNHGYSFVNTGAGKAANNPVQTVNWYDCVKWCNARSQQAGKTPVYYTDAALTAVYTNGEVTVYANWTAAGYRLPTEAEWEKAARGGLSGQRFPWGNVINQNLANYHGDTADYSSYDLGPDGFNAIGNYPTTSPGTSPVGSFAANGYGLNDMVGNVWQWCWDWYGTPYVGGTDPRGFVSGSSRVIRGGCWVSFAIHCRAAIRSRIIPTVRDDNIGFRSVLPPGL